MAPNAPLDALAARVRSVVDGLPEREREALTLRERDGLGYAEIANRLGVREADVAGILVSARLWIRSGVRQKPTPPLENDDCPRARELMVMVQDGELDDASDRPWLPTHVGGCASCGAPRLALREGSLAFRALEPEAPEPVVVPVAVAEPEPEPIAVEPEREPEP